MNEAIALLGYRPAEYVSRNESVVTYYVVHPETGKPVRKRIKLNHVKPAREREKVAAKLVAEINSRLHNGWNPFLEQEAPKAFTAIFRALDQYIEVQARSNLRDDTMRAYRSMCRIFKSWLTDQGMSDAYLISFTTTQAVSYMNHVLLEREVSPRTWNNNLMFLKGVWNWFISQQMSKANPFSGMKKKKNPPKRRTILQGEQLSEVWDKLHEENQNLYFITRLIYYCLLRPKEISKLRVSDINMDTWTIRLRSDVAKSRRTSHKTIPRMIQVDIRAMVGRCNGENLYLFAGRMEPGAMPIGTRTMESAWRKFRDGQGLPKTVHLYSFKDSGIVDMYNAGIPEPDIQRQADHVSGEITRIYADHINPQGIARLREFRPSS